jgi:hypothetical protein
LFIGVRSGGETSVQQEKEEGLPVNRRMKRSVSTTGEERKTSLPQVRTEKLHYRFYR